ncbi:protein kinase [Lotmaria passim]
MDRDGAGVAASQLPSNSNARRPRKSLKAAMRSTTAPGDQTKKPTTLADAVAVRHSSNNSTKPSPTLNARRRAPSTTAVKNATTAPSKAVHEGKKGQHTTLSTATPHNPQVTGAASATASPSTTTTALKVGGTSAASTAPPLLAKQRVTQSRTSSSGLTPRWSTATSGTAAGSTPPNAGKAPLNPRSRSVSVSKQQASIDSTDAKTRTAGIKLPPLPREGEELSAATMDAGAVSPKCVLSPLQESALQHSRTPPSSPSLPHHLPLPMTAHSLLQSGENSISSHPIHAASQDQLFGPMRRSTSLAPVFATNASSTSMSLSKSGLQELPSRSAARATPKTVERRTPTSQQTPTTSQRTSPRHSGPTTTSASPFAFPQLSPHPQLSPQRQQRHQQQHVPNGTMLFEVTRHSAEARQRGEEEKEPATLPCTSADQCAAAPAAASARMTPIPAKATTGKRSSTKKKNTENSAAEGMSDEVKEDNSDDETAVNEDALAEEEEEDGEEDNGDAEGDDAGVLTESTDHTETSDEEDASDDDASSSEEEEEEEDEEDSDDSSDEEDDEEGEESDEEDDESDREEDESPRKRPRGGRHRAAATSRAPARGGFAAAAAGRPSDRTPWKEAQSSRAASPSSSSSPSQAGVAHDDCKREQKKKGREDSPVRICTKISREGDLNVKVVYAIRTRHCFNRYVKEIMTRFGFAKATDFDMYCVDATGDRVDIDIEEDFNQLLDAFEMTMAEAATEVQDTPARPLFTTTVGSTDSGRSARSGIASPDDHRGGKAVALPAAPAPLRASRLQSLQSGAAAGSSHGSLCEPHSKAGAGVEHESVNNFYVSSHANNSPLQQQQQQHVLRSPSPSTGFNTTTSLFAGAGVMEDDGKSSASVLRLYVRYSNAYYLEHGYPEHPHSPNPAASSLYASPSMPVRLGDPNGTSLFTNQLQRLSSLCPTSDDGRPSADALMVPFTQVNNEGTSFSHTLLASAAGSRAVSGSGGLGGGGTVYLENGFNDASTRSSHFMGATTSNNVNVSSTGHESLSPESASLALLTETQRSAFNTTFVVDGNELVEWRRMSVLGKGSFGTVYEGITMDGKMIAVKVQELPQDDDTAEVKALQTEINLMRSLKHRNIVAYYGCQTRVMPTGGQQLEIFMELCHGGSLATLRRKLIKTQHVFGISLVRSYTRQVLEGLAYLHAQHVIHRDIKCDNVLISATGEAKLADFGCSKRFGGGTVQTSPTTLPPATVGAAAVAAPAPAAAPAAMYQTMVGSPFFMAPEVMREDEGGYTSAADIWSVGCLVIELLGREPWEVTGTNIFQILFRIAREQGMPTGVPRNCPAMLHSFFERCFDRDPAKRATAAELLEHPWITCPDKMLEEVSAERETE